MNRLGIVGLRTVASVAALTAFLAGVSWTQEETIRPAARLRDRNGTIRQAVLIWMQERCRQLQTDLGQASPEERKRMVQELQSLRDLAGHVAEIARHDPQERVREAAIHTLAALQPDLRNESVRQTWEVLLQDRSPGIALAAAESVTAWLEFPLRELNNPHAELRTLELIERLSADLLALRTAWTVGLGHGEIRVRQATLRALHSALTTLPQRLIGQQDAFREEKLREATLAALRDLTVLVERLGQPLADNLALPHATLRRPICEILEALGELVPLFRHSDLQPAGEKMAVRLERPLSQLAFDLLAVIGEDRAAEVRLAAASALETLAPVSPQIYPELLAVLDDDEPWVRWTIARCLMADRVRGLRQEQQRQIVHGLARRLVEEGELSVRLRLAQTLRTWRSQLDAAPQELGRALQRTTTVWPGVSLAPFPGAHVGVGQPQRDPEVLLELLAAIREFAEHRRQQGAANLPGEWLNGLESALRAEKAAVRAEACRVLEHYGTQAYRIRPALTPLLRDSDPQVRAAAARALLRIIPAAD